MFVEEKLAELGKLRSGLQTSLEEIDTTVTQIRANAVDEEKVLSALKQFPKLYAQLAPFQRKELVRLVVAKAEVGDGVVRLHFHGKPASEATLETLRAPGGSVPRRSERSNWLRSRSATRTAAICSQRASSTALCPVGSAARMAYRLTVQSAPRVAPRSACYTNSEFPVARKSGNRAALTDLPCAEADGARRRRKVAREERPGSPSRGPQTQHRRLPDRQPRPLLLRLGPALQSEDRSRGSRRRRRRAVELLADSLGQDRRGKGLMQESCPQVMDAPHDVGISVAGHE